MLTFSVFLPRPLALRLFRVLLRFPSLRVRAGRGAVRSGRVCFPLLVLAPPNPLPRLALRAAFALLRFAAWGR